jgi:hypothetical protein
MGLLEPRGRFGGIGRGVTMKTDADTEPTQVSSGFDADLDQQLDEGLEESFPASDSLAVSRSSRRDRQVQVPTSDPSINY